MKAAIYGFLAAKEEAEIDRLVYRLYGAYRGRDCYYQMKINSEQQTNALDLS